MPRAVTVLLAGALLLGTGCRSEPADIRETTRIPDAEGVVEEISPGSLKLAGGRGYEIAGDVKVFTTGGRNQLTPDQLKNRYVHLGLSEGRVVWISSIGLVQQETNQVFYTGRVAAVREGRIHFDDGTVLKMSGGEDPPEEGATVVAILEASSGRLVELRRA